jgi:RNA polymerase sigma-70 factor (ECF subfamily)
MARDDPLDPFWLINGLQPCHPPYGEIAAALSKSRAAPRTDVPPDPRPLSTADVFEENAPFAWRLLRRLGVSEGDIDDVCQEVFVTVHRRLSDFEGRSSVRTWVYGICIRTASDYRRRVRARREEAFDAHPEPTVSPDQERRLSLRQARDMLDRILDQLDDNKRAVFVLYEIEELPMADVAHVLGCPLQTAYSRLHAARGEVETALDRLRARGAGSIP